MAATRRGHREGTKQLRKDGRWEWKITLPDGSRRSFYGKTEREAREKKNRAIRDYEAGLLRDSEKLTVNQYLDRWLEDTARDRVRPSTLMAYTSHIEIHIKPAMKGIRLRELNAEQVNRLLSGIVRDGKSPTTANRVRATLRTALASAVKARMLTFNAAALSDARKEQKKRVKPPTVEETQALIRYVEKDRMGPLIITAIYTALREGELLGLTVDDIDLEEETIEVNHTLTWIRNPDGDSPKWIPVLADPKTEASRRKNHLPKPAVAALKRQREIVREMEVAATGARWKPEPGMDMVFPSTVGRPQNASNMTNRFSTLVEGAGLPHIRFHDLRHLSAALLLAEGMDIFAVKEYLGHSQISQTANTYGHLMTKLSKSAASALNTAIFDDDSDDNTDEMTTKMTTDALVSVGTEEGDE